MEVINANSAFLCNHEAMLILQRIKDTKENKKIKKEGSLATVTYETLHYLQNTECTKQSEDQINRLLSKLKRFKLTKTEKLMIINTPPRSPLEIQLIVQESEERLSEEQVEEIITIVKQIFPPEFE